MKAKCFSVRLESLITISDKAYKALAFDGSTAIIPKSQVFGRDYDVQKSEAYWISEWILSRVSIQYSHKKSAWFGINGKMLPSYSVVKHAPEVVVPKDDNTVEELLK